MGPRKRHDRYLAEEEDACKRILSQLIHQSVSKHDRKNDSIRPCSVTNKDKEQGFPLYVKSSALKKLDDGQDEEKRLERQGKYPIRSENPRHRYDITRIRESHLRHGYDQDRNHAQYLEKKK